MPQVYVIAPARLFPHAEGHLVGILVPGRSLVRDPHMRVSRRGRTPAGTIAARQNLTDSVLELWFALFVVPLIICSIHIILPIATAVIILLSM